MRKKTITQVILIIFLIVLTFIVFKKYSEKDAFNISISDKVSEHDKDNVFIWKELLNNMRKNNIQN